MRDFGSTLEKFLFWGPTTVAGTLSATGVALLLTAVASAPAYSMPAPVPDPATVATVRDTPARNCFMGQHRWVAETAPQPQCTVAQRTASYPTG